METIEKNRKDKEKEEARLDEAEKELKKFNEGEDDGVLSKKLRRKLINEEWKDEKQKRMWEETVKELKEKETLLEESKKRWEKQVGEWGEALRKVIGEGEGNEQIA